MNGDRLIDPDNIFYFSQIVKQVDQSMSPADLISVIIDGAGATVDAYGIHLDELYATATNILALVSIFN